MIFFVELEGVGGKLEEVEMKWIVYRVGISNSGVGPR